MKGPKWLFLLQLFIGFQLNVAINEQGRTTDNSLARTSSALPWIIRIMVTDTVTPTGEQLDKRNYRLSLTGRSTYQMNATAAVGKLMPFVELGEGLYYFQTYFKANYFRAYQFCREHGMELVSIESKDENTRIIDYLQDNLTEVDNLWTSGNDLAQEGTFVWLSTGRKFTYTHWVPPNPDNSGKIEHCMHLRKIGPKHYRWNDVACNKEYNFACSFAVNSVTKTYSEPSIIRIIVSDVLTPIGEQLDELNYNSSLTGRPTYRMNETAAVKNLMPLVELGEGLYYFQTYFKANFFKAYQFCREHGMDLLSIETKDENNRIIDYLQENLTDVENLWTSGNDLDKEGSFVWLSTGRNFTYTNWIPPNPDNKGGDEHCMHITKRDPKHYIWNDIVCTSQYYFACELK